MKKTKVINIDSHIWKISNQTTNKCISCLVIKTYWVLDSDFHMTRHLLIYGLGGLFYCCFKQGFVHDMITNSQTEREKENTTEQKEIIWSE